MGISILFISSYPTSRAADLSRNPCVHTLRAWLAWDHLPFVHPHGHQSNFSRTQPWLSHSFDENLSHLSNLPPPQPGGLLECPSCWAACPSLTRQCCLHTPSQEGSTCISASGSHILGSFLVQPPPQLLPKATQTPSCPGFLRPDFSEVLCPAMSCTLSLPPPQTGGR